MTTWDRVQLNSYVQGVQQRLTESPEPSLASLFHERSKCQPRTRPSGPLIPFDPGLASAFTRRAFKEYPLAESVALPEPPPLGLVPLDEIILRRRTRHHFASTPLTLGQVAALLGLSYRVTNPAATADEAAGPPYRPVPSGGALYPLEIYLAALGVEGLVPGLYHYHPVRHALETLDATPPRQPLRGCVIRPDGPLSAGVGLILCGVLPRNRFKYGELGYRLLLLEAGHAAQNMLLVAETLGLGSLPCCGFYDDPLHDYLQVDGVEEVGLYIIWIGVPDAPTLSAK